MGMELVAGHSTPRSKYAELIAQSIQWSRTKQNSLIYFRHVLSAAHCAWDYGTPSTAKLRPEQVSVSLGHSDLDKTITIVAKNLTFHPRWNKKQEVTTECSIETTQDGTTEENCISSGAYESTYDAMIIILSREVEFSEVTSHFYLPQLLPFCKLLSQSKSKSEQVQVKSPSQVQV